MLSCCPLYNTLTIVFVICVGTTPDLQSYGIHPAAALFVVSVVMDLARKAKAERADLQQPEQR